MGKLESVGDCTRPDGICDTEWSLRQKFSPWRPADRVLTVVLVRGHELENLSGKADMFSAGRRDIAVGLYPTSTVDATKNHV